MTAYPPHTEDRMTCQIRRVWKDPTGRRDIRGPWEPCPTCHTADGEGLAITVAEAARFAASAWEKTPFDDARRLPQSLQFALDVLAAAIRGGTR